MRLKVYAGVAAAVFFAVGSVFAQTQPGPAGSTPQPTSGAPGGIPMGPLVVYPGVELAYGHDDNLFMLSSNIRASDFLIASPYVRAEAKTGPHKFEFGIRIDDGTYYQSHRDDYFNYALTASADLVFSGRAGMKLNALHRHAIDPRGSNDRTISLSPDEWDKTGIDGVFRYGAPGARGRIEVDAGAYAIRYTNNRLTTEEGDRDETWLGGTFFWRVGPRTELLFQAKHGVYDYRLAASTQDSTDDRYYVGVKWEATAATSGTAKIGYMNKKFDGAARQDISDSSWELGMRWSPLTYSVFDIVSSKYTSESTGVGDATVSKNFGATWSHAWSSRLRTQAVAGFRNDDFVGAGATRNDYTSTFGLKVDYDFRRWLRLGAAYTYTNRNSNDNVEDYKRNLLLFTVGATL